MLLCLLNLDDVEKFIIIPVSGVIMKTTLKNNLKLFTLQCLLFLYKF